MGNKRNTYTKQIIENFLNQQVCIIANSENTELFYRKVSNLTDQEFRALLACWSGSEIILNYKYYVDFTNDNYCRFRTITCVMTIPAKALSDDTVWTSLFDMRTFMIC